jgi:hypothetical protein
MRKGRILFSLFLIAIGLYAVRSAMGWTFKAALFPLAVSIPFVIIVAIQLAYEGFGGGETAAGPAVDVEFTADVPSDVARRRAIVTFLWIGGFVLLVYLVGFPLGVPIFVFSYLGLQGRVGWPVAVALTLAAWLFFYGVFQQTLRLRFEEGLIQTWLGV